jgi:uncharacterized lipoprotein YehR (DUF1307 family)
MRETRLFVIVLVMSILIVSLIGCSKTEDDKQQASTSAAQSATPAEHEVVLVVREFIMAFEIGD